VHHDEQVLECSANDERSVIPLHVEFKQGENLHLQGVSEYGYGYWSRYVFLGEKGTLYTKPAWLGMSRLTTNKEYKDFDQPGDRTLAV
jgi:protein transport protein SEC24